MWDIKKRENFKEKIWQKNREKLFLKNFWKKIFFGKLFFPCFDEGESIIWGVNFYPTSGNKKKLMWKSVFLLY